MRSVKTESIDKEDETRLKVKIQQTDRQTDSLWMVDCI